MQKGLKNLIFRKLTLVVFSAVLVFSTGCSSTRVQTVEEETEANQIINVLREHGIRATKVETGEGNKKVFEIFINGGDDEYGAAIQLMDEHCLPQMKPPQIESEGLVPSAEVEKARDLRRMKLNIENQLRNLPGVTCVIVNLGKAVDNRLTLDPEPTTATVSIKHKTRKLGLSTDQIAGMVAGGITGLEADKVFVTLTFQPLKPLPNLNSTGNTVRIFLVGGIGLITIIGFFSIVFFMRKRREINRLEVAETQQIEYLPESESELPEAPETEKSEKF